jgi:DNA primase
MESFQSAKEEVKRAANIVELIGQYVQIKKAGQNYLGLCPFHSEKDPSFTVSPSKQMFHCFGCKKGGDVFAFWMEYHKVTFPQALKDLADRYQVILPEKPMTPFEKEKTELKASLFKINEVAAEYFHGMLTKSEKGRPGRGYFAKRSIPKEVIRDFRLGYVPNEWDGLIRYLRIKKVNLEKAAQAGLVVPKKNGGYYDRFRGRVIFPIFNMRQQIVGFGGRVLDDSLPKYINTPETPIFHKGGFLYGLHASHKAIRDNGRAVVVEGYMDVLALRRCGFQEVAGTLGTALTREHIRSLKGYAEEAIVVFDSDSAGKAAAIKSLSSFMNEGLSSKVIVLPQGDDPDSYVSKNELSSFLALLKGAVPMFDYYLDSRLAQKGDGVEQQVNLLKEVLPVLAELDQVSQQSLYLRRLSEKLGIAESVIRTELQNWQKHYMGKATENGLRERLSASKAKKVDDLYLLNVLIHHPQAMNRLMSLDYRAILSDPVVVGIFDAIHEVYAEKGVTTPLDSLEFLKDEQAREQLREAMLTPPIFTDEKVEQALNGFEDKIYGIKMTESKIKAAQKGDLEGLNRILELKREREGRVI